MTAPLLGKPVAESECGVPCITQIAEKPGCKGDRKFIHHYDKTSDPSDDKVELFNLSQDRDESHNLASTQPEKLAEMMQAMNAALEDADAQYPTTGDGESPERPEL